MKRKTKTLVAEYIEWLDHVSLDEAGWKSRADAADLEPAACRSVGFVIKETANKLTLVSSIVDDHIDGEVSVIKSCITKREVIWPKSKN